jgi:hypothetical protein
LNAFRIYLLFIHKKTIDLLGNEYSRLLLFQNYFKDIVAIKIADFSKELFLTSIMLFFTKYKLPVIIVRGPPFATDYATPRHSTGRCLTQMPRS